MCIHSIVYIYIYIYIHTHTHVYRGNWSTGLLNLHSPVNSRRLPEISLRAKQASCRYSWKTVFLPFAPVDFRRKPEPVPRAQVLSLMTPPNQTS